MPGVLMIRMGIGFDAHRFEAGRKLVLGGAHVPHDFGLAGHSDADALSHAVADALLGALSDGDIGEHFPDTDPEWKDADSLEILALVADRLRRRNARIVHVDAVVIAECPRLAPYRDEMSANLARALGVGTECVSVKATTAEGMGAIGRREGVAVMAAATVDAADAGAEE